MRLTLFSAVVGYHLCAAMAGNEKDLGTCEKSGTRCKFVPSSTEMPYCFPAPVWDASLANTYIQEMSGGNVGHTAGRPPSICFCPTDKASKASIFNPRGEAPEVPILKKTGIELDAGLVDEHCRTWGSECILDEKNKQCRLIIDNDPAQTYCLPLPDRAGHVNYLYAVKPNQLDKVVQVKIGCYCQHWKKAGGYFFHPALSMTVFDRKEAFEKRITESHDTTPTFKDYTTTGGDPAIGVKCIKDRKSVV